MRIRFGRAFVACAAAFLLAAVVVAAVRAGTPFAHAFWLVAYLGLVGGVSQLLLGPGLGLVVERAGGRGSRAAAAGAQLILWNAGTVAVAVAVLVDAPGGVLAGSVLLLVALGSFAVSLRRAVSTATRPARPWIAGYVLLLVFLAGSVVVGAALASALPGQSAAPRFTNPVFGSDFPDPFVLRDGGAYYAYGTNGGGANVQVLRSSDLVHWQRAGDAMPTLAPWVVAGNTWAPEVLRLRDGRYVLFYAAYSLHEGRQCVGRAVARGPAGPFRDRAATPFLCQPAGGGSIDPDPFRDADGRLYLLWKNDGNCCGLSTYIYAQRLSADGSALVGRRARLLTADQWQWEGPLVEAPTLWREHGRYVLFFSASAYNTRDYAVGYATCAGPLGPCRAAPRNPILASACRAAGPGGQAIVRAPDGQEWLVYHAWRSDAVGSDPGRVLWIDRLDWRDGVPVVAGPTCGPQPAPR